MYYENKKKDINLLNKINEPQKKGRFSRIVKKVLKQNNILRLTIKL